MNNQYTLNSAQFFHHNHNTYFIIIFIACTDMSSLEKMLSYNKINLPIHKSIFNSAFTFRKQVFFVISNLNVCSTVKQYNLFTGDILHFTNKYLP